MPRRIFLRAVVLACLGIGAVVSRLDCPTVPAGAQSTGVWTVPPAGDAARGREVFARGNGRCIPCSACHHADRADSKVGPSLARIGLRPPDEVVRSILEPAAAIVPGHEWTIVTTTVSTVSGLKASEDAKGLVMLKEDGELVAIAREEIARDRSGQPMIRQEPGSLMPSNYGELLTADDLSDLFAYLMSLKADVRAAPPIEAAIAPLVEAAGPPVAGAVAILRIEGMV